MPDFVQMTRSSRGTSSSISRPMIISDVPSE